MVDYKRASDTDDTERNAGRIAELLDDSTRDLPPRVRSRLAAARHSAVSAGEHRPSPAWMGAWAGLAASLLVAMGVVLLTPDRQRALPADEPETILFSMAEMDELGWALVQDLEFAYWLSESNNALQPPSRKPSDNQSG